MTIHFQLTDALTGRQPELRDAYRHLSLTPSPGGTWPLPLMRLAGIYGRPVYLSHDASLHFRACSRHGAGSRFSCSL